MSSDRKSTRRACALTGDDRLRGQGKAKRDERRRQLKRGIGDLLHSVERLVERLEDETRTLPKVAENGDSDCWFAESLYAQKDELEAKLMERLPELRLYLEEIEDEIRRTRQKADTVASDGGRLKRDEPKSQYQRAAQAAANAHERDREQQQKILELILRAQDALRQSLSRKYPGKIPRSGYIKAVPSTYGRESRDVGSSLPASSQGEIGGLLSLGPLGRPQTGRP